MSEAKDFNQFERLRDSSGVLASIHKKIKASYLTDGTPTRFVIDPSDDEVLVSEGLVSESDFMEAEGIDLETAEKLAEIENEKTKAIATMEMEWATASLAMFDVFKEIQHLQGIDKSEDEIRFAVEDFEPRQPHMAYYTRSLPYKNASTDEIIYFSEIELCDESGNFIFSGIRIDASDGLVATHTTLEFIDGAATAAHREIRPADDPLIKRAISTLSRDDYAELFSLMMSSMRDENEELDIDARLGEIWTNYIGTSKEQEVGPLLDELRDRCVALRESQRLKGIDVGQLNLQDLIDLDSLL